jgi:flagellar biosynthesis/type III secretory pathway protein FliH
MSLIKKYDLDGNFDEQKKVPKHTGSIIKSPLVIPTDSSITAGQANAFDGPSTQSIDPFEDTSFDDFNSFDEPQVEESAPEPIMAQPTPAMPQVDESQIRQGIMADLQANFDELMAAVSNLKEARDSVIKSAESQLIEMALMIAEKVIEKKIESDPNLINSVIEDTFNKISGSDRITFKINPADADAVNDFQPTIESRLVGVEKITIQQDSTIQQGGCIIETDLGFVDVTIQEKLNLITQTFKKIKSTL